MTRASPVRDTAPGGEATPAGVAAPLDDALLRAWPLPPLDRLGDKEDRGRVLVVAGSRSCPGGARLAALAALRAGAGKVTVATVRSVATALAVEDPELRVLGLNETDDGDIDPAATTQLARCLDGTTVLLVGPGQVDEAAASALAARLLADFPDVPTILDAASMRAAVGAPQAMPGTRLLLPHAGELAHLTGASKSDIERDPVRAARQAASAWASAVAVKGARTALARPDGHAWLHAATGRAGLGTAGSGDVLAGIIAGLAARRIPLDQAAAWGIVLHARAGERLEERDGGPGFLARELLREVPGVLGAATASADAEPA